MRGGRGWSSGGARGASRAAIAIATLGLAACVTDDTRRCGDLVCPATQVCAPAGGECVGPDQLATCDGKAEGDACTLEGVGDGSCRAGVCRITGCGDTILDPGEQCDDGNEVDDDACTNRCTLPVCGDGVRQGAEGCDDGAANSDDRACTAACQPNVCGDGKLRLGQEACDAGDANANDSACTLACTIATCGDGHRWAGVEPCDDGNRTSGDGCRGDCRKVEVCGDGEVDASETCDDGNAGLANPADGCDACTATTWQANALLGVERLGPEVDLAYPSGVAVDRNGNLFIADRSNHRVRRVAVATGIVSTVAGTGTQGFAGDGGAATSAQLDNPLAVAVDGAGNLFVADTFNHRIRRVAAGTGVITTVAGAGWYGFSGDGEAATSAAFASPQGIALDGVGNLFIADGANHRVRRVDAATGVISTVAGTGSPGFSGDGAAAVSAQLFFPRSVAVDRAGNLFIADSLNDRIRRVDIDTGVISTIAGTGVYGSAGDGGPAGSAQLAIPSGVVVDDQGHLWIAEFEGARVRRVEAETALITTVAGTGAAGFSGDGGAATSARITSPTAVAIHGDGTLYVADAYNNRIRRVAATTNVITTVVGTGNAGFSGDGGAATSAQLPPPWGVAVDGGGNLYIANESVHRIRRVDAASGVITTIAGTGVAGTTGDGGGATQAQLAYPSGVAVTLGGEVFIADFNNNRVRRVAAATGVITTVAGTGTGGWSGDGGDATSASLAGPRGVALDGAGNLFIADTENHRIRRVAADSGTITTVAGTGIAGDAGDGGDARFAQLANPTGVTVDQDGNLFIADRDNHRVRRVAASSGQITTAAGDGNSGFAGDGDTAPVAQLASPWGVAIDGAGNLLIADTENHRIRRVAAATGIIRTVAGGGGAGLDGDGRAATEAQLHRPYGVAVDAAGNLFIADKQNQRVRRVDAVTGALSTVAGLVAPEGMGPATQARLADPRGLVVAPAVTLVAGGATGTVQALRPDAGFLETVAGRYPQPVAAASLARFRDDAFGTVGDVAYDAATARIYLTETSHHRIHVITATDLDDEGTWSIASLAGDGASPAGTPGFHDGAAASARFDTPTGLFFDEGTRTLYVADTGNHVIRTLPIDLAGDPGEVATLAGTPRTRGLFGDGGAAVDALLYGPAAITRCDNGDVFIADTANHRVRRIASGTGTISTVLGDGVAASSGQGVPASSFPVDTPLDVACDPFGNLLITSRTVVRLLVADGNGDVDGTGAVQTIYGAAPRTTYPASVTSCLTGLAIVDAETAQVTDSCVGVLAELWRQPLP